MGLDFMFLNLLPMFIGSHQVIDRDGQKAVTTLP
jgi:hypothetical protein